MSSDTKNDSEPTVNDQILIFNLDELPYALPLKDVVRVIQTVEIRHLPGSPNIVSGIINVHGDITPVVNIRERFGLPKKEIDPGQLMIIADTGKRKVAFITDTVQGLKNLAPGVALSAEESLPFAKYLKGVAKIDNELILIYDLEEFLGFDEEKKLDMALRNSR